MTVMDALTVWKCLLLRTSEVTNLRNEHLLENGNLARMRPSPSDRLGIVHPAGSQQHKALDIVIDDAIKTAIVEARHCEICEHPRIKCATPITLNYCKYAQKLSLASTSSVASMSRLSLRGPAASLGDPVSQFHICKRRGNEEIACEQQGQRTE